MGDFTYIDDFHDESSSSEDEELDAEQPQRKRRRVNRTWLKGETYESSAEAEEYVRSNKFWKISSSTSTASGKRVDYRCAAGKYRVNECPAGLYLLYHSTNLRVSVYRTENEHKNHITEPTRGLSIDVKNFVERKYKDGITKPKALLHLIRDSEMPEPPKSKLVSFLRTLRSEVLGSPTISVAELQAWCAERQHVPHDHDEPYVLASYVHAASADLEEQDLKLVISTRRSLSLIRRSRLVQIDATYKLIWQGYPVIIVGTSDANHVFHPFAVAVTKGETAEDFAFVFRAVHEADLQWNPTILLADGSEAITNGFQAVFSHPFTRLMCFFHVRKQVDMYLRPLTKDQLGPRLKGDIYALQTCASTEHFEKASQLFLKKWRMTKTDDRIRDFIDYFEKEWFLTLPNWYEGAAPGFPSTNNGLEATNAVIKKENTLRERLPVGQFLTCAANMMRRWSQQRDPHCVNCTHFADTASISLPLWTSAYQWATANAPVLHRTTSNSVQYFVTSSQTSTPITTKLLSQFQRREGKWSTFDEFKKWRNEIWEIQVFAEKKATCTCPLFLKGRMCKHSIGMLIRQKELDPPSEARNIRLGQKRKRGRPSKAKKALLV